MRSIPIVLVIVTACGSPDAGREAATGEAPRALNEAEITAAAEPTERVALAVEARRVEDTVIIDGSTDLPDGAVVTYELRHERFGSLPSATGFTDGAAPVRGGAFTARVDVAGWPRGAIELRVAFQTAALVTAEQPQHVIDRYGPRGELLGGDNVTQERSGHRIIEVYTDIR